MKPLKRIAYLLKKYLWCSWLHRANRCDPEVDKPAGEGGWHCMKCHPCSEGLAELGIIDL